MNHEEYSVPNVTDGDEVDRFLEEFNEVGPEEVYQLAENVEEVLEDMADMHDTEVDGDPRELCDVLLASARRHRAMRQEATDKTGGPDSMEATDWFYRLCAEMDEGSDSARINVSITLGKMARHGKFFRLSNAILESKYSNP